MNTPHIVGLGVDIGGTKMAFALVDQHGQTIAEHRLATPATPTQLIDDLGAGIVYIGQYVPTDSTLAGIGIGIPGRVDAGRGVVNDAVNLGWHTEVPLVANLRGRLAATEWHTTPIRIAKDTHAAIIGQAVFRTASQGQSENVVLLSLGTGLGAAAIINGQLVQGITEFAMELGHLSFNPHGRLCACGQRGCVEMYMSGKGLLAGAYEHTTAYPDSMLNPAIQAQTLETGHILDAVRQADPLAKAVFSEAIDILARTVAVCLTVMNPRQIVFNGGIAHAAWDILIPALRERVRGYAHPVATEVVHYTLLDVSAAAGAAALLWFNTPQHA